MTKKSIFRTLLSSVIIVAVCMLTGCTKEETVTYPYSISVGEFNSPIYSDLGIIDNYLISKGLKSKESFFCSGKDIAATDADAIAQFNAKVAKLSYNEVAALGLSSDAKFSYNLCRSSDESGTVVLRSWDYPAAQ